MGLRMWGTGWWEYERTAQEGPFVCPSEKSQQTYRMRRVNRWITVVWIPVVPLGSLGTFVQCRSCKNKFGVDVLASPQQSGVEQTVQPHEV